MIQRIKSVLWRRSMLAAALLASALAAVYWGVIASDRYVSEARIIIQGTDLAASQSVSIWGLLGSVDASKAADQMLLRDHLLSVDMLKKLDSRLKLRAHYSDGRRDPLSRMWSEDTELEWFHRHYLSRVSVDYDDVAGVLVIKAQAYDPRTAHAVATMLVDEGERFMNDMAHNLAQAQVVFLERQVLDLNKRVVQTRQAVLDYQNRKGLVSPQATTEHYAAIVNSLESELTNLQTRRTAMLSYLVYDSPSVVEINQQISAVEKQIAKEKARLTSPRDKTLNLVVEEFQRLQMNAEFALEVYKTALAALESGRLEATRTLKKVSVLQSPFEPQYPLEPRRMYNTVVFILIALVIAGIMHLLLAIIRDHQD